MWLLRLTLHIGFLRMLEQVWKMPSKNKLVLNCTLAKEDAENKSKAFAMKPDTSAQIYIITYRLDALRSTQSCIMRS